MRSKRSSDRASAPRQCAWRLGRAAKKHTKSSNFLAVRRKKNPADLEKSHTFRSRPDVSLQRRQQTGNQTRPQRDVIFAERIAQLDRFPGKARA